MDEIIIKFLNLYDLYHDDVFRLAFSFTKNIYDAEDITQSVFTKLYQELFKDKNINKNWLLKVTANNCKNNFKLFWKKKVVLSDELLQNKVDLRTSLKEDELSDALLKLSYKYRIIIYLYYYEGYKVEEIADILNLKISNIKVLLSRGRKKLKIFLEEIENEKQ